MEHLTKTPNASESRNCQVCTGLGNSLCASHREEVLSYLNHLELVPAAVFSLLDDGDLVNLSRGICLLPLVDAL